MNTALRVEWPTLALAAACYALWAVGLFILPEYSLFLAVAVTATAIALHSSLTHEIVHGHPVPDCPWFNHALVFPTLILAIPFGRFRDTHLAHHVDAVLTDPYDDPESNYLDPAVWGRVSWPLRTVLSFNNILLGRLLLGPAISLVAYLIGDLRSSRAGDARVRSAWLLHIPEAGCVVAFVFWAGTMPFWAYLVACYGAMSIVKIRTFLEHQAHDRASGRTAIVEDSGLLSWMFLNNNLHVVHHMHPRVPWYDLPKLYAEHRAHYVRRNGGYVFRSYSDVFARYFLKRKDPVPHPHYPR